MYTYGDDMNLARLKLRVTNSCSMKDGFIRFCQDEINNNRFVA